MSATQRTKSVSTRRFGITRRALLLGSLGPLAGLNVACSNLRSAAVPIHQVNDRLLPAIPAARSLLVLLPGLLDYAEDFDRFGFHQAVRARRLPIDIVSIDANLRYFENGTIVERIHQDVVLPARALGYQKIWLAGISLGGLGAMLYAANHPEINGLVAIAPFLGRPNTLAEIDRAGGHAYWQSQADSSMFDWERELHLWLKRTLPDAKTKHASNTPQFILAYGEQDRYAQEQKALARQLHPSNVIATAGEHDWPTWRTLWDKTLDRHGDLIATGLTAQKQ